MNVNIFISPSQTVLGPKNNTQIGPVAENKWDRNIRIGLGLLGINLANWLSGLHHWRDHWIADCKTEGQIEYLSNYLFKPFNSYYLVFSPFHS